MALSADRKTPMRDGETIRLSVAASTKMYAGGMVAKNASGYTVPAADAAGLMVMGRAEEYVDNSSGANGDETILVRRNRAFKLTNSAGNPVTIAEIGKDVFIEDDETVSKEPGTNSIVAGKCIGVESDGVWVFIPGDKVAAAQADSEAGDLAALKADFNALLAKLRAAQIMDS